MVRHWLAALAMSSAMLAVSPHALGQPEKAPPASTSSPASAAKSSAAPSHTPSAPPATYSPRAWPIVVGSLIFVPMYAATVYWAFSGDATSYGIVRAGDSEGEHDFGSPGFLLIPIFGPLVFHDTFCSDATDYYKEHPYSDEPQDACGGGFWQLDFAIQLLGAGFITAGFLNPVRNDPKPGARVRFAPMARPHAAGLTASGSF